MTVLYYLIVVLARVLNIIILADIVLSWIPIDRRNPIVVFVHEITEPLLGPIRRVMTSIAGFDFSPIVAIIILEVAERVLLTTITRFM